MSTSWSVAEARARFAEVLHAAEAGPQSILSHGRPVAVIVAPAEYEAYASWQRSRTRHTLSESLDHVREAAEAEEYTLEVPARTNRPNGFP